MHIIIVAWVFVVVLVALAEATAPQGTVLGAVLTLLGWGVLPLSIVVYVLNTPARKRRLRAAENPAAPAQDPAARPDGQTQPPASATAPVDDSG